MKFAITCSARAGRTGIISNIDRLAERTYKTPLLLWLNPQLSREVIELTGFDVNKDFGMSLPVSNIEQMEKPLGVYAKGISEFVGLKECLTLVSINNSAEKNTGHHEKGSLPIWRKSGKINLTAERYMKLVEVARPDMYLPLADGDTFQGCSKKRLTKACERSEEMIAECIKAHREKNLTSSIVFSVQGGFNEFERKKFANYLMQYNELIFGYNLDGFHCNGHDATFFDKEGLNIVEFTNSLLPQDKLRMMLGAYLPHKILELIKLNVDVFDTSLVTIVSSLNRAMVFNFDYKNPVKVFPEIDLLDGKYKDDFSPFSESCDCLACKQHTKAYTNHLLLTKELLGSMLLVIHNLHYYKRFFEAIRESIKEDRLQDLINLVSAQYDNARELNYEVKQPERGQKTKKFEKSEELL